MAAGTGLRHAEKALRLDDLSAAVAGAAGCPAPTVRGAVAVARVAGVKFVEADFLFAAVDGFLEGQLHVVAQVGTARRAGRAAPAARRRTNPRKCRRRQPAAEDFAEDIEWIVETRPRRDRPGNGRRMRRGQTGRRPTFSRDRSVPRRLHRFP